MKFNFGLWGFSTSSKLFQHHHIQGEGSSTQAKGIQWKHKVHKNFPFININKVLSQRLNSN